MAHFAKLDKDNKVVTVEVVANGAAATEAKGEAFLNRLYGTNDVWKQCSYNTREGVHYTQLEVEPYVVASEDQSKAFRLNFPGRGWTYDESADAFYAPRPVINGQVCNSWTLNTSRGMWEPPTPKPADSDDILEWDESTTSWVTATPNNG
tara:strand:+ start:1201 stop:1650 length:450 start_codon:yes stop_codon:yes gene_type:complete